MPAPLDQTAPPTPTNLAASSVTATSVHLSWTGYSDNAGGSGLAGFKVYRGSVPVGTVTSTTFDDYSLKESTAYSYTVAAFDNAQNHSVASNAVSFTTSSNGATTPPAGLTATAASSTLVNLAWTASTSSAGIAQYRVERLSNNGIFTQIGTPTANSYADSSVSSGIAYVYRVRAVDNTGNFSPYSLPDLATTVFFADDPIPDPGVSPYVRTKIKAEHITVLRQAVDAVRTCAGLTTGGWAESIQSGVTAIKSSHIMELRSRLDVARTVLGLPAATYTDPGTTANPYDPNRLKNIPIKRQHIQELRQNVQ